MSKIIDNICKLRDILEIEILKNHNYNKLIYQYGLFKSVFNEMHRHLARKSSDYSYELDFTAQDLRELAADIRAVLKHWETLMNPEKNIKALKKVIEEGTLNLKEFTESKIPILRARRDNVQMLYELLNLCEFHSVFLYYLEYASNDEFAIKHTERV